MKKNGLFLLAFLLALPVFYVTAQQGGFTGPGADITTVEQAKKLRDETNVLLKGYIQHSLGNEKYIFSDDTGTITVEIDREVWGTLSVNENDLVEISGEVDRGWNKIEIEVKTIKKSS